MDPYYANFVVVIISEYALKKCKQYNKLQRSKPVVLKLKTYILRINKYWLLISYDLNLA
jgi:hypothetical protein